MLDWIIIGGGVHGVFYARTLLQHHNTSSNAIRIIDPGTRLMQHWFEQCRRCGMQFLRSSSSHCLDPDFRHLRRYARQAGRESDFIQPYNRPSLELFRQYAEWCIQKSGLERLHIQSTVTAVEPLPIGYRVHSPQTTFDCRNILLTVGQSPPTACALSEQVWHLLDTRHGTGILDIPLSKRVAIVGGGITGAGAAIARAEQLQQAAYTAGNPVMLYSEHPLKTQLFDFNPGFVGPKKLRSFSAADRDTRQQLIRSARNHGTVPDNLMEMLKPLLQSGQIRFQQRSIGNPAELLSAVDCVVLAGGFGSAPPGEGLLQNMADAMHLPLDSGGLPRLDEQCRWGKSIYVSGAAAINTVGPAAPNIIGAHLSYRRIFGLRTMHTTHN